MKPVEISLKEKGLGKFGFSLLIGLTLYSCATAPRQSTRDWLTALPGDGTVYFSLSLTPAIRAVLVDPFIKSGFFAIDGEMTENDAQELLSLVDRMERIHGSVRLSPEGSPGLNAVVEGRFPSSGTSILLNKRSDWKKRSVKIAGVSGINRYWISEAGSLQVSVPKNRILLVSNEDVRFLLQSFLRVIPPEGPGFLPPEAGLSEGGSPDGRTPPDGSPPVRFGSADLLAIVPDLQMLPALGNLKSSVRSAWILVVGEEDEFHLQTGLALATQGDALKFTMGARLFLLYWLRAGDLENLSDRLKEARIVSQGNYVYIANLRLSESELKGMIDGLVRRGDDRSN